MRAFLGISIGFHALFFTAISLFPAGFAVKNNARIMEVSFYEGRGYFPNKVNVTNKKDIAPIIKEVVPLNMVEEKIREPEPVSDISAPERTIIEGPALGSDSAEPGYGRRAGNIDPVVAVWFSYVKERVERLKRYPNKALEEGTEGKTVLQITVLENGTLSNISVFQSSGSSQLDAEADRTVRTASPFRPLPAKLGNSVTFRLPIKFEVRK